MLRKHRLIGLQIAVPALASGEKGVISCPWLHLLKGLNLLKPDLLFVYPYYSWQLGSNDDCNGLLANTFPRSVAWILSMMSS
jgi:hypothetical protein